MNSLNKKLLENLDNLFESQSNVYIKPPFNRYYRVSTPAEIADLEGLDTLEFQNFEAEDPVREYTNVVGYAIARDQYRDQIEKASGLLHAEIGEDGKLYYNIGEKVFEVETDDVGINYDEMGREIESEVVKSPSKSKKIIKELDDKDNTSSIYIDLREIISYAEKYISNELKANGGSNCKITTAQDGQYMITLNRSDNSIKAYCDLGYGNASEELDENRSKGELKEEFIPNNANLHCPECGSSEYYEVDDGEYEDGRCEFHHECKKCGYVSSKDEYYPEDLEENDRDVKVETCTTEETGGNVYVSYGKLSDNTYFAISTDLLMVFDQDRLKASYIIDSKYDGDSSKWESEHLVKSFDYSTPEYKCIAKQIHDMRRNTQ